MKCWNVVETCLHLRQTTSCLMYPPKIWLNGVVSLVWMSTVLGSFLEMR